jgi:peptidyl-tRNA hydrolase, PTH2 family
MKVKQVIVVRKDLNMRKGKIAAQVGHASLGVTLDMMDKDVIQYPPQSDVGYAIRLSKTIDYGTALYEWVYGIFTKIVVYVNSEEEILDLAAKANAKNIPYKVVTDSGLTEFNGQPTVTCVAIGPDWSDRIDKITGGLPLL